jgi:hypothetical protein
MDREGTLTDVDLERVRKFLQLKQAYRALLDDKLTELMLYAKELCPEAVVKGSATSYEDEDGHVDIFPPPGLPEEEERIELTVAARPLAGLSPGSVTKRKKNELS